MCRIHVAALLALSALALPTSTPFAQVIFGPGMTPQAGRSSQGRMEGDAPTCQASAGGSRVRENCEAKEPTTVRIEQDLKVLLELPAQPSGPQCEATTLTEYFQRNTMARVDAKISISNCLVGTTGTFTVVARVRDESGEIKPIEFNETWQRDDAEDVSFNTDYPIGENVELVSVRVRNLICTCAGGPPETAPQTGESLPEQL
jgi:hypothetical protein